MSKNGVPTYLQEACSNNGFNGEVPTASGPKRFPILQTRSSLDGAQVGSKNGVLKNGNPAGSNKQKLK